MWVAKFSLVDKNGVFSWRNKKFKVKTYAYRTGFYVKSQRSHLNAVLLVEGSEKNKQKFIKSLEEDALIEKIEIKNDLVTCLITKPAKSSSERRESIFYSLDLIHIKPVFTDEKGVEFWEIGSWDRLKLSKILAISKKLYACRLLSVRQVKLSESSFLFFSLYPKLTQKQKQAFLLALHNGYYEFPREIELKHLAKFMRLSYTSYQFHLRHAEKKIMNSVGLKI